MHVGHDATYNLKPAPTYRMIMGSRCAHGVMKLPPRATTSGNSHAGMGGIRPVTYRGSDILANIDMLPFKFPQTHGASDA